MRRGGYTSLHGTSDEPTFDLTNSILRIYKGLKAGATINSGEDLADSAAWPAKSSIAYGWGYRDVNDE